MYCKRGNNAQELNKMVYRSDLRNLENGNYSDLDRDALLRLLKYYKTCYDFGNDAGEELIIEDDEEDY